MNNRPSDDDDKFPSNMKRLLNTFLRLKEEDPLDPAQNLPLEEVYEIKDLFEALLGRDAGVLDVEAARDMGFDAFFQGERLGLGAVGMSGIPLAEYMGSRREDLRGLRGPGPGEEVVGLGNFERRDQERRPPSQETRNQAPAGPPQPTWTGRSHDTFLFPVRIPEQRFMEDPVSGQRHWFDVATGRPPSARTSYLCQIPNHAGSEWEYRGTTLLPRSTQEYHFATQVPRTANSGRRYRRPTLPQDGLSIFPRRLTSLPPQPQAFSSAIPKPTEILDEDRDQAAHHEQERRPPGVMGIGGRRYDQAGVRSKPHNSSQRQDPAAAPSRRKGNAVYHETSGAAPFSPPFLSRSTVNLHGQLRQGPYQGEMQTRPFVPDEQDYRQPRDNAAYVQPCYETVAESSTSAAPGPQEQPDPPSPPPATPWYEGVLQYILESVPASERQGVQAVLRNVFDHAEDPVVGTAQGELASASQALGEQVRDEKAREDQAQEQQAQGATSEPPQTKHDLETSQQPSKESHSPQTNAMSPRNGTPWYEWEVERTLRRYPPDERPDMEKRLRSFWSRIPDPYACLNQQADQVYEPTSEPRQTTLDDETPTAGPPVRQDVDESGEQHSETILLAHRMPDEPIDPRDVSQNTWEYPELLGPYSFLEGQLANSVPEQPPAFNPPALGSQHHSLSRGRTFMEQEMRHLPQQASSRDVHQHFQQQHAAPSPPFVPIAPRSSPPATYSFSQHYGQPQEAQQASHPRGQAQQSAPSMQQNTQTPATQKRPLRPKKAAPKRNKPTSKPKQPAKDSTSDSDSNSWYTPWPYSQQSGKKFVVPPNYKTLLNKYKSSPILIPSNLLPIHLRFCDQPSGCEDDEWYTLHSPNIPIRDLHASLTQHDKVIKWMSYGLKIPGSKVEEYEWERRVGTFDVNGQGIYLVLHVCDEERGCWRTESSDESSESEEEQEGNSGDVDIEMTGAGL